MGHLKTKNHPTTVMSFTEKEAIALYSFELENKSYKYVDSSEALSIIKGIAGRIRMNLAGSIEGYSTLLKIKFESYWSTLMVGTSDLIGGASFPSADIWDEPQRQLNKTYQSIASQNVESALSNVRSASIEFDKSSKIFKQYVEKNAHGYESTIHKLEFVKDKSALVIGVYNPYIGSAYKAVQELAQSGMEVHYNMKDRIDYVGIGINVIVDEIVSLVSSKLAGHIIEKLNTQQLLSRFSISIQKRVYELLAKSPQKIKEKLIKFLTGKFTKVIGEAVKTEIENIRHTHKDLYWDKLKDKIAEKFGKKELIDDLLESILEEVFDVLKEK